MYIFTGYFIYIFCCSFWGFLFLFCLFCLFVRVFLLFFFASCVCSKWWSVSFLILHNEIALIQNNLFGILSYNCLLMVDNHRLWPNMPFMDRNHNLTLHTFCEYRPTPLPTNPFNCCFFVCVFSRWSYLWLAFIFFIAECSIVLLVTIICVYLSWWIPKNIQV